MDAPYYIIPLLDAYAALPPEGADKERARLETLISVNIGDRDVLADVLGFTPEPFDDFYNDRNGVTPDTGDTISLFLSNFGNPRLCDPAAEIPAEVPVVPAIDYVATYVEPEPEVEAEKAPQTAPLTESLVKILVKTGKYEEALQIIKELNLKNPQKSIYFADQMRFLRKVMLSKQKNRT